MSGSIGNNEAAAKWKLMIEGSAADWPALSEVNSFLVDINRAYEFARVAARPEFGWSLPEIWQRRLRADETLRIKKLHVGSPLNAEFWFVAIPSVVAAVELVYNRMLKDENLRVNLKTAKLTNRRLEREEARDLESPAAFTEASKRFNREVPMPAGQYLERIIERQRRATIHLGRVRIELDSSERETTRQVGDEEGTAAGSQGKNGRQGPPTKE